MKKTASKTEKKTSSPKPASALTRREQAQQSRMNLKLATTRVLDRMPFRQMRVADVTTEAGVAAGLFYHYFPDLKTITQEILVEFMATLTTEAREVSRNGDIFTVLRDQFRIMIMHYERHPGLMRCMLQASDETPEFGDIWKSYNDRWTASFARYIADQWENGPLNSPDILLTAYCLGAMSDGVLQERYVQKNPNLAKCIRSANDLATTLASLTYRAIHLRNPSARSSDTSSSSEVKKAASRRTGGAARKSSEAT